ncbi:uncharacterized protein LOC143180129 [Calliopsis andreniformis]|uniref:uncharacterized protein LOC143180129 n=1 Tax=Calliopsis andreniformis TaxID=337506 RepID=UPI003FCE5185
MTNESAITETELGNLSDYSLQLNRWYLKPIGAWPSSSTSRIEKIISVILIILCYCSISFTVIPCMLHIMLEDESIRKKLRVLGPLSHWFVGGINYTTLLLRSNEIRCCMEHLKTDWQIITRVKDRRVMLKNTKMGRYVAAFCAAFMQGGVLSYCLVTALAKKVVQDGNETRTVHMLPCAFYKKLLDIDSSPTNEIILASQFLSGFIVNSSAVAAFSLAAVFAAHARGQLNVLMIWITEFVNESRAQSREPCLNKIGVVVEHHLRVLSFIAQIEDVMNRICFSELFKCTLGICMLGYYILTEWSDHDYQNLTTYFMILISMTFNIFIVCYIGEVLTEQCKKIGEVVYMTDWYYLPHKSILDLLLIIARSNMVTKITAGKLIHMSVYTFGDVMKTSFAYLNLLHKSVELEIFECMVTMLPIRFTKKRKLQKVNRKCRIQFFFIVFCFDKTEFTSTVPTINEKYFCCFVVFKLRMPKIVLLSQLIHPICYSYQPLLLPVEPIQNRFYQMKPLSLRQSDHLDRTHHMTTLAILSTAEIIPRYLHHILRSCSTPTLPRCALNALIIQRLQLHEHIPLMILQKTCVSVVRAHSIGLQTPLLLILSHKQPDVLDRNARRGLDVLQLPHIFLANEAYWHLATVIVLSSFLIGFLLIPCGLCAILKKGDLDTKIKMIGPLSFIIMATTKYYILVSRGDQIAKCIENIRSDWTRVNAEQYEENRRIMIENANFGKSLTIFCAGFTTEIIGNETVRIHAFQMYRGILDVRTSPSFEIVQFMQIVSGYVLYSLTIGACSLAAVFVTHTRGQFRIIIRKLENLVTGVIEKDNLKSTKEQLGDIIDHHLRILGFISKVEDLLNEICFVDIIGCTLNICFLGYYLLTILFTRLDEWERNETIGTLTYFALLISYLYNIFTLCFRSITKIIKISSFMIKKKLLLALTSSNCLYIINYPSVKNSDWFPNLYYDHTTILLISIQFFITTFIFIHKLLSNLTFDQRCTARAPGKATNLPLLITHKSRLLHYYRSRIQSTTRTRSVKMRQLSSHNHPLGNEYYETDIRYNFQICEFMLKLIGIYPFIYNRASRGERIRAAMMIILCNFVMHFVTIPFGFYILFCEKDLTAKIKFIGPLLFCVSVFFKYCYLGLKSSAFRRCIEYVERDWRNLKDEYHRAIMIKHATMSRNLSFICAVFLYTGCLCYHTIMPLLSGNKVVENFTIRPLTYPGYEIFFDVQRSPIYESVYVMHCVYVVVLGNITMAAYSLTAIFTTHACGQIEIQKAQMENLKSEKEVVNESVWEHFVATIVRKHVEILRFTRNVEKTLRELLLMEVVVSTLEMCLLEYYCVMEWETNDFVAILTYVVLLTSFTFNILIFCYVGELLLGQGNQIWSASYNTQWYNVPGRKARPIVLMLAISMYPLKLTAGRIVDLSINTFGVVHIEIVGSLFEHVTNGYRYIIKTICNLTTIWLLLRKFNV